MREPLYRAKTRGSNPEWVYGYYCKYGKHIDKIHCVNKDGYAYLQIGIDVVTLGQYTGLTDKNGNKIFEGDILSDRLSDCLSLVKFEECRFKIENSCGVEIKTTQKAVDWFGFEIIGNIHDNPELLEK